MSGLSKEQLLSLYRTMLLIRRTEEQLIKFYAAGKIYGGVHTYIGEEAVAAGVCAHLRDDDTVFSTHRGHGHALAKGVPPRELIAEVMGRATGCSGGRGGSMHLFKPEVGFMGSSGIVGPCITLAAGGGYSAMLLKTDRVSVAFFGDGASNNGAFHEGLNLAAAWKLPAVFVCENNLYATEVPLTKATGNPHIAARRRGLRAAGHRRGRQRRAGGLPGGRRGRGARPRRRRPHPDRVPHLPHARPRRGDARRRLPHAGGDRGLEGTGPDQALPRAGCWPTGARPRPSWPLSRPRSRRWSRRRASSPKPARCPTRRR